MTRDEAILHARKVANEKEWPFLNPVSAHYKKRFLWQSARWTILTNADKKGQNVRVVLDDASNQVLEVAYLPR